MPSTRCPIRANCCRTAATLLACAAGGALFAGPEVVTRVPDVRPEAPPRVAATDLNLQRTLDAPVAALAWRGATLREALAGTSEAYSVAVVRDRRIDPAMVLDFGVTDLPLREVLGRLAAGVGGETRVVGNAVYLGPPEAARVVRTLVELRSAELEAVRDRRLAERRLALRRGRTVRWGDLAEPVEIVRAVAAAFGLRVENPEAVPHDLWAGGVLPDLSAAEALTVVLVQLDLTFAWSADLESVRLRPLPPRTEIVVERGYPARGSAGLAAEWRERFPEAGFRAEGDRVLVTATVDVHDDLKRSQGGPSPGPRRASEPKPPESPPLGRRLFTLTVTRVPVRAVMAKLEESGVAFDYDAERLKQAGVDLDTPVSLDLRQAEPQAFFEALFGPTGAAFEMDGNTVRLRPGG